MSEISPHHPLYDAKLRLDQVPAKGRHIVIDADSEECAAIAARMRVETVSVFHAELMAVPIKGGIQVRGSLSAELTQSCVVTFDPVTETVSEDFARIFLHGSGKDKAPAPGAEIFVDFEGEDLPDYFDGPEVDFTEFLMEVLALSINPYPRAPEAEIPKDETRVEDGEAQSPFAALKQLKSRGD